MRLWKLFIFFCHFLILFLVALEISLTALLLQIGWRWWYFTHTRCNIRIMTNTYNCAFIDRVGSHAVNTSSDRIVASSQSIKNCQVTKVCSPCVTVFNPIFLDWNNDFAEFVLHFYLMHLVMCVHVSVHSKSCTNISISIFTSCSVHIYDDMFKDFSWLPLFTISEKPSSPLADSLFIPPLTADSSLLSISW